MDWKRIKNQVLSVVLLLAAAGCATTSQETAQTAEDSAPASAFQSVSKGSPAPVAAVTPKAESNKPAESANETTATNHSDIWIRIRAGFSIEPLDSPLGVRGRAGRAGLHEGSDGLSREALQRFWRRLASRPGRV